MINVAINGFGRIGRVLARILCQGADADLWRLVAVNDPMPLELAAHLLRYDSTYGEFGQAVQAVDSQLHIGDRQIQYSQTIHPDEMQWSFVEPTLVFECSGQYTQSVQLQPLLKGSVTKILTAAPLEGHIDATIVYGINHTLLSQKMRLVSNASCTTHCLAAVLSPLVAKWPIQSGTLTSIHAATADQNLQDGVHEDFRLARSALQSIVPTKTGATHTLGLVMPELLDKFEGWVMRVPTLNVSAADITVQFARPVSAEQINTELVAASQLELANVLAVNGAPLVSIDYLKHPASAVVDLQMTKASGSLIKLLAWYDNEWAFANRMVDTAHYWCNR
jgi:glyceraldehyde 3-phosphate dehydrogenase (phosphorylating)